MRKYKKFETFQRSIQSKIKSENCFRSNCHPGILAKVRKYYSIPDFLPEDADYPAVENIFFGYEIGAVMHVNIFRLMSF